LRRGWRRETRCLLYSLNEEKKMRKDNVRKREREKEKETEREGGERGGREGGEREREREGEGERGLIEIMRKPFLLPLL
jgi:hypothetical protein